MWDYCVKQANNWKKRLFVIGIWILQTTIVSSFKGRPDKNENRCAYRITLT